MMSNQEVFDDLRNWVEDIDTGQHYTQSNIYRDLVFRQNKLSTREHRFDQPVLVPEGHFEELVRSTRNHFVEVISDGEHRDLQDLEETLPKRLDSLTSEIEELTTRIESLCKIRDQFRDLDSRFETLDDAAVENELPESVLRHETSEGAGTQEFEAVYDASQLFENEVGWPVYRGDNSPLCIAAHARMPLANLREERLAKRKAWAVGKLRLRILKYVRAHYQITGFPPKKLSLEDAEEEAENACENARKETGASKGGRPPMVSGEWEDYARDEIKDIRDAELNHMLSSPAFHSLTDDGEVETNWTDIEESMEEGLFSSPAAIRQHVDRSDNIDLEEKKKEVRDQLAD